MSLHPTRNENHFYQLILAPVLKTIFINVSYHMHVQVAGLTLMAITVRLATSI